MFVTFKEANEYLENFIPHGYDYNPKDVLKLDRISYLLKLLGNPHKKIKTIHIGGTSGKGSTAYILSQLLTSQGYKTGLHISPHLQTIRERMQINGEQIPDENFVYHVNRIEPLVGKVEKYLGLGKPTYFETTVAIAFDYFAKQKVNIAVIEVGLGGKLDATNVIHPLISIITNVDLDHTEFLGNTVEKIAEDKSGIIKKGVPVITGSRKLAVRNLIANKALKNTSEIFLIGDKFENNINKINLSGSMFDFTFLKNIRKELKIPIPASFQVENASIALTAVLLLKQKGYKINEDKLFDSLSKVEIPGRFEIVQKNPFVILDGAHNPAKVQALIDSLKHLFPKQKFIFLVAFKRGKDIESMLKKMIPHAESLIITEFNKITDMGRRFSTPAEEIERLLNKLKFSRKLIVEKDSVKAFQKAKKITNKDHPLIITGSLYLVGEIRDIVLPFNK